MDTKIGVNNVRVYASVQTTFGHGLLMIIMILKLSVVVPSGELLL